MELGEGILTRRSIRKFVKDKTIPDEDVKFILDAAMHAPSARNKQPWEFVVVNDKNMFGKIAELHPYAGFIEDASLAVFVCGNLNEQHAPDYWVGDTAAASENLLLACHAKGLGACWCGIYPQEDRVKNFKRLLGLPEYVTPLNLIVIGYPDFQPSQPNDRFKPSKVHYNHW